MQSRGYLGPEQQDHHAVVDYTASRYLTHLWTHLSFNKHKNIKGSLTAFHNRKKNHYNLSRFDCRRISTQTSLSDA